MATKEYNKMYYYKYQDDILKVAKKHRTENAQYYINYRNTHREEAKEYAKKYYKEHREEILSNNRRNKEKWKNLKHIIG